MAPSLGSCNASFKVMSAYTLQVPASLRHTVPTFTWTQQNKGDSNGFTEYSGILRDDQMGSQIFHQLATLR